jgi:hypothetical protein
VEFRNPISQSLVSNPQSLKTAKCLNVVITTHAENVLKWSVQDTHVGPRPGSDGLDAQSGTGNRRG